MKLAIETAKNAQALEHSHRKPTSRRISAARRAVIAAMLVLAAPAGAPLLSAQTHTSDPASARLREELAVVTDLGRLLGFVYRMEQEQPALALSRDQASRLARITDEIHRSDRLTPTRARAMMDEIEDRVLTAAQLTFTDQLFLNREQSRVPGSGGGTPAAGGSGNPGGTPGARAGSAAGGQIAAYEAGGPYNPIRDQATKLGQDFTALRAHLDLRRR